MGDLKAFPANKAEALAMLYLERQNLSGKSPVEIADMFKDAYDQIRKHSTEDYKGWFMS